MAKFIIKKHYISFPGEGYYSSFTDVECHTVGSAPTLYGLDVRLQEKAVFRGFDGTKDFDVISEKEKVRVGNCVTYVVNEHVK
jgi:hypothetical protein